MNVCSCQLNYIIFDQQYLKKDVMDPPVIWYATKK